MNLIKLQHLIVNFGLHQIIQFQFGVIIFILNTNTIDATIDQMLYLIRIRFSTIFEVFYNCKLDYYLLGESTRQQL